MADCHNNGCKRNKSRFEFVQGTAMAVTALLLLGGCVSRTKYDALAAQYQQLSERLSQITANQKQIAVTINDELLFPSGGWQMPAEAQQTIAPIVAALAAMPKTNIVVNGYTDNSPIGPQLMHQGITSNLVLSQKRAENVMGFLASQGFDPTLMSAQGFGDTKPVASNATAAGRARNRRVELILAGYHDETLLNVLPHTAVVAPSQSSSSMQAESQRAADSRASIVSHRVQGPRHCVGHCSSSGQITSHAIE